MMKKIFSILSLMLMFACCNVVFTSCGDDDEDETTEDKVIRSLVGNWEFYEPGSTNTVHSLTLNSDGTYYLFVKDIVYDPNSTETDKEGYLFKYKGTYSVTKDKFILTQEFAYEPILRKDPADEEWHKDVVVRESSYRLENGVLHLSGLDEDGTAYVEVWDKVKK